jgi:diguanylate cyclase (GGDEF)-like protein
MIGEQDDARPADGHTDHADALRELTERASALLESDAAAAWQLADEALRTARRHDDAAAEARALWLRGRVSTRLRDYAAAFEDLVEARRRVAALDDPGLEVDVVRALLRNAFLSGDRDAALTYGVEAVNLADRLDDARRAARAHNDLGLLYGRAGDYEGALEQLLAGMQLLRDAGSAELASLHNNIGNVYFELGDARQALDFFRSAHAAFSASQAGLGEAIALGNVGRALALLGEHDAALAELERSLHRFESLGASAYLAPALARVAAARAALGDDAAARTDFARALDALDDAAHHEFGDEVLLEAGRFHLSRGEAARAVELFAEALRLGPDGEESRRGYEIHLELAAAHEAMGDAAAALGHFREYHRIRQSVADTAVTIRIRGLMLHFDLERARQQEELYRLRYVELAAANDELRRLHAELEARNRELQRVSIEDALTGLYNRRYFDAQLEQELARALRYQRPLAVALCDLDHFKSINDRFSHRVGDEVLRAVGQLFRATIRADDIAARYGGEEFVLILPETDRDGALVLLERLSRVIAEYAWERIAPGLGVTLSIGVAALGPVATSEELLAAADANLYRAKAAGRDRVWY